MPQPSPIPTRILQRHQSQIARDLLPTLKAIRFPDDQYESQCGQRTHSGMGPQAGGHESRELRNSLTITVEISPFHSLTGSERYRLFYKRGCQEHSSSSAGSAVM